MNNYSIIVVPKM